LTYSGAELGLQLQPATTRAASGARVEVNGADPLILTWKLAKPLARSATELSIVSVMSINLHFALFDVACVSVA
jgi:hypothetical protein